MADASCVHLEAISTVRHGKRRECAECVKIGSQWVHLRTCQQCGATLCCDSSPNQHASKHAHATKRSEERRVGKECRSRGTADHKKKNEKSRAQCIE